MLTDTYTLNNGVKIPVIGFGTWQTPSGQVAKDSVLAALNSGYRHIDTAQAYASERGAEISSIFTLQLFAYLISRQNKNC